jgi:hypothetical protein
MSDIRMEHAALSVLVFEQEVDIDDLERQPPAGHRRGSIHERAHDNPFLALLGAGVDALRRREPAIQRAWVTGRIVAANHALDRHLRHATRDAEREHRVQREERAGAEVVDVEYE